MKKKFLILAPFILALTSIASSQSIIITGGGGGIGAGDNTTFTGDNTFSGTNVASGRWAFGTSLDAAFSIDFNLVSGSQCWEGALADTAEACIIHTVNAGFDTTTTFPALGASQTVMYTNQNQTVSGALTFTGALTQNGGSGGFQFNTNNTLAWGSVGQLNARTENTPDVFQINTGTSGNSIHVREAADFTADMNNGPCGTTACVEPTVVFNPATSSTTQYNALAYWGSAGRAIKTLTEATNTSAFQVSVASGAGTGGVADYTVFASDGTDHQTLAGDIEFAVVNKAGTETCTDPTAIGTAINSNSTGTLTCTYACDETPANAVNIQFNCTSSLTQTTLEVYYHVRLVGPGQVTPQ